MSDAELNHMVRMANQIAANVSAADTEAAIVSVASHIERFWAGAMCDRICNHLDQLADELSPTALAALSRLKQTDPG